MVREHSSLVSQAIQKRNLKGQIGENKKPVYLYFYTRVVAPPLPSQPLRLSLPLPPPSPHPQPPNHLPFFSLPPLFSPSNQTFPKAIEEKAWVRKKRLKAAATVASKRGRGRAINFVVLDKNSKFLPHLYSRTSSYYSAKEERKKKYALS